MQNKITSIILIILAFFLLAGSVKPGIQLPHSFAEKSIDTAKEQKALIALLEKETLAFYNKDLQQLSECWAHDSYVRHMGWWKRGGIRVVTGWDSIYNNFKQLFASNPR
ncbi:MAG: hypothetical protein M3015_08840, partial [Bacteroidota bacterium]|nr:hypothetical protein [Bacteroidota bacterium]